MMTEEEAALFMERVARRFAQCLTCRNDPSTCGGTDADENERGMCMRYSLIDLNGRKGKKNEAHRVVFYGYDDRRTDKGNTNSNRQDREQTEKIRTTPTSQQTAETTEKGEQWQSKSYLTKIA